LAATEAGREWIALVERAGRPHVTCRAEVSGAQRSPVPKAVPRSTP